MDSDGKYSLQACNLRLKADKSLALVRYYSNRRDLALQTLMEKSSKLINNPKLSYDQFVSKTDELRANYNSIKHSCKVDTERQINIYNRCMRLVSSPTNPHTPFVLESLPEPPEPPLQPPPQPLDPLPDTSVESDEEPT